MCMSIVASAFQYGCAPTLMPATTTLISPPAWVNSMIRRSALRDRVHVLGAAVHRDLGAGRQREPLHRQAALLGQVEGRDDEGALGHGDRAERLGRVAEQRDPGHALGVARRSASSPGPRRCPRGCVPGGRSTGTSRPSPSRSCSTKRAPRPGHAAAPARRGRRARGPASGAPSGCSRPAGASARSAGRSPAGRRRCPGCSRSAARRPAAATPGSSCRRPRITISSRPAPTVSGAIERANVASCDSGSSMDGQAYRKIRLWSSAPAVPEPRPRPPQAVEAGGQQPLDRREADDLAGGVRERRRVAHLRHGDEPLVVRVLLRDHVEQVRVLGRRQPHAVEVLQPPEVEPLRGQRVHPPDDLVLGQARAGPIALRGWAGRSGSRRRRPGWRPSPSPGGRTAARRTPTAARAAGRPARRRRTAGPARRGRGPPRRATGRRSPPRAPPVRRGRPAGCRSAPSGPPDAAVPRSARSRRRRRCARRARTTAGSPGCAGGSTGG